MKLSTLLFCFLFTSLAGKTQVPSTEIFLVEIIKKDSKISYGKPLNITNRDGYDNQPWFTPDSRKIIFVSMPDTTQSDLYEYTIADSTTKRLTETPESEYSPRFAPDGKRISMVRVNDSKAQNFAFFNEDPDLVEEPAPGLDSVAYYCWMNDSTVAIVNLNKGMELLIYELQHQQYIAAIQNIGRCLLLHPQTGEIIFTMKGEKGTGLYRYNLETSESHFICKGVGTSEDYVLTSNGKILTGDNGILYGKSLDDDKDWIQEADFTKTVGNFYRLAISPDGKYLALVAYAGKRP